MTCARAGCNHSKDVHGPVGAFCKGDITCQCTEYETPLSEFINLINQTVAHFKSVENKVKYILQNIPNLRNAGSKSFPKAYKNLVYDIKQNEPIPRGLWKSIPSDDTITRTKRKVQHDNPELAKFNRDVIKRDIATQQGILEWVTGFDE